MKDRGLISVFLTSLGITLSTVLLINGHIGQASFITLICAFLLIGVVVYTASRLHELDLKNLKLTLHRFEEIKSDIYAKENDLRATSLLLSELIVFQSIFSTRFGDDRSHKWTQIWSRKKVKELLDVLHVSDNDRSHVFRFSSAVAGMDKARKEGQETDNMWESIIDRMESECADEEILQV